jgi:hypothetical protein
LAPSFRHCALSVIKTKPLLAALGIPMEFAVHLCANYVNLPRGVPLLL